jgi:PAS domain S-box-containing protein
MRVTRVKIDVAFGAALILLGIAALLAFRSVNELRSSQGLVAHTERVLREIATVHANVYEAESAQRGYLLTRRETFLGPYIAAPGALDEGLIRLESLVADNDEQSGDVRRLRELITLRLAAMEVVVDHGERGDFEEALRVLREGTGRALMDSISVLSNRLAQREFELLEERRTEEAATAGGTILFVLMGGIGAILIVATSRQGLLHELERRETAERRLAENSRYLRELYTIASSLDLGLREKLDALVALGARRFDAPIGILARQRSDGFELVAAHDRSGTIQVGSTHPLDEPCFAAAGDDGFVALEGPAGSVRLCCGSIEVRSCLRTLVRAGREERGLLVFADPRDRSGDFSEEDRDFLHLIGQWIGSEVERSLASEELRQREERYRLLVESASDLIFTTDRDARFTYVNPVGAAAVGYPQEKLRGTSAFELVRHDYREAIQDKLRRQIEARIPQGYYEIPVVTPQGREVWLGHNVQLLTENGVPIGLQAVARDITKQREMEQMKDEFLSVVSHELRTPLTAIRGSLGLLASGRLGELGPQGQRMLEIAAQNTDRLVRLINDLLDIDKIASGNAPLQKRPADLKALSSEAIESMRALAEREEVTLLVDAQPLSVIVDPDRMLQVLTNLLSNAIKFSTPGSAVRLTATRRENQAIVSVTDRGRGIPPDKLQSIFERFQQVDSSDSRRKGGTGLGLAIVRQIVEQHGGEVTVQSEWGVGSTFTFTIPMEPDLQDVQPPISALAAEGPGAIREPSACDVLIVEDDIDLARVIAEMLRTRGITSRIAKDGLDAIEVSRDLTFSLLLLDPGLPQVDGFQLVAALRDDPRHREVPVLVYTTRDLNPRERDALRLGPTDFLTKSRHPLNLLEGRITTLLDSSAAGRTGA